MKLIFNSTVNRNLVLSPPALARFFYIIMGIIVNGAATFCLWWLIRPNPVVGLAVIILFGTFYAGLLLYFYHIKQW